MKKIFTAITALLLCVLLAGSALAGTSIENGSSSGYSGSGSASSIPNFLFYKTYGGIQCGVCPVYTAPSTSAYRCANGRAVCDTNSDMMVAGFEPNGWLMVRYSTNNGGCRVGYIPPKYVKNYSTWHYLNFSYVAATAQGVTRVTDNPLDNYNAFATLDDGETYYILGEYTYYGNWWYIECTVDGRQARGFIAK